MQIRSERDTAIADPGCPIVFELRVRDEQGEPAAALQLAISVGPDACAAPADQQVTTDDAGRAIVTMHAGARSGAATVTASHGAGSWRGTVYVTGVALSAARGIVLAEFEEELLRILFRNYQRLRVVREFGGGLSGNRVLQVQASDARGPLLSQVVKLGARDDITAEGESYELFRDRLQCAAPVAGSAVVGTRAAIIYGDATAAAHLDRVISFGEYFTKHGTEDIRAALYAVLASGLRRIHGSFHVVGRTHAELVSTYLPEDLVVTLDSGDGRCGVFRPGAVPALSAATPRIQPRDIGLHRLPAIGSGTGELVALEGFRIGKMQEGDLNLEDEERTRYKIKVRFDPAASMAGHRAPPTSDFATGDRADVVARFVCDRDARIRFAVRHCLVQHGFAPCARGYALDREIYPDPVPIFASVLDRPAEVACGTIHGDLHWENILLEGPSNWWLIDYGLSRGNGPILFDFVKLELYLRRTQLYRIDELSPMQVLAFEDDLAANPLGRLPAAELGHPELDKAADAIRTIRRLARRYVLEDFFGYLRFVFVYALALAKYHPTEDRWQAAEGDGARLAALAKLQRQSFFSFAPALAIGRVLEWERLRKQPESLNFAFVPMGSALTPEPGRVVLDVGNRLEPGVVDHHQLSDATPECTTSLVWKRPELVTDHLGETNPDDALWLVHHWPDFDCVAATYLAWIRAKLGYFPPGAAQLQRYAFDIDAGGASLESAPFPERTPYALFALHLHESDPVDTTAAADAKRMRCGFAVMDFLCRQEACGNHTLHTGIVPHEHGFWNATMRDDRRVFEDVDLRLADQFQAELRRDGRTESVNGLVLQSPRSLFFKVWARASGSPLLVVKWVQPDRPDDRIVISVPPDYRCALLGLGAALERAETEKRAKLGRTRPTDAPRWADVDNNDPWYDGRSPVHAYTIVDSPRAGTVLNVVEVVKVLRSRSWRQGNSPSRGRRGRAAERRPDRP